MFVLGKTAVINMVFDNIQLRTSSSAVGCTDKCASVRGSPRDYPNINLRMVDTVGLCESLEGTVPSDEALNMLEGKLDSLYCKDGIHLILFCIRKGRQSKATTDHYQTIVHGLCENKVPCLLVITRCEDDDPLGEWWQENKDHLRNTLHFNVADAVAVTTVNNEKFLADYNESRKRLIESIGKYALTQPWHAKGFRGKFNAFLKKNIIRPSNIQPKKSDPLTQYLQRPMTVSAPTKSKWSWLFS